MSKPLLPKGTAVWLIDNTALTFEQISEFCGLELLMIESLANDEGSIKVQGVNPVTMGSVTAEEIKRCEADPKARMKLVKKEITAARKTKGPRYTPVAKRQDKPDAIAWLVKNHPELSDGQIGKLIGTTRNTIEAIRSRSHWNIGNIRPQHPVLLGLCKADVLAQMVKRAQRKQEREAAAAAKEAGKAAPQASAEPAPEPAAETAPQEASSDMNSVNGQ